MRRRNREETDMQNKLFFFALPFFLLAVEAALYASERPQEALCGWLAVSRGRGYGTARLVNIKKKKRKGDVLLFLQGVRTVGRQLTGNISKTTSDDSGLQKPVRRETPKWLQTITDVKALQTVIVVFKLEAGCNARKLGETDTFYKIWTHKPKTAQDQFGRMR